MSQLVSPVLVGSDRVLPRSGFRVEEPSDIQRQEPCYEKEILRKLGDMEREEQGGQTAPPLNNTNKARAIKHRGQEPMRQALYRMSGVDATHIDAIGVETLEVVFSEYGPDLSRFPTEKQFVSHLTLAPHVPTSSMKLNE